MTNNIGIIVIIPSTEDKKMTLKGVLKKKDVIKVVNIVEIIPIFKASNLKKRAKMEIKMTGEIAA